MREDARLIGFELPEIDFRIQSLDAVDDADLSGVGGRPRRRTGL
jgi:hypothetical protein